MQHIFNLFWGFLSVAIISGLNFISLPLYLKYLDEKYYAILSVWLMVNALLQFLDLGLSNALIQFSKKHIKKNILRAIIYEKILIIFLFLVFGFSFFTDFPPGDVYILIKNEIGPYSFQIFILPILFSILIKLHSFYYLSKNKHKLFNFINVKFEILKHIGGFLVLLYTRRWDYFFYYQLFISVTIYLILSIRLNSRKITARFVYVIIFYKEGIHLTKILFLSSLVGTILLTIDKIILTNNYTVNEVAVYTSCFVLASVINLIIQPFHRLSLPLYRKIVNEENLSRVIEVNRVFTKVLSKTTANFLIFVFIFFAQINEYLFENMLISDYQYLVLYLSLSLWVISCSWLSANLLQILGHPRIQLINLMLAIFFYLLLNYFGFVNSVFSVGSIWYCHAFLQFIIIKISLKLICDKFSISIFFKEVYFFQIIKLSLVILFIDDFYVFILIFSVLCFLTDIYKSIKDISKVYA